MITMQTTWVICNWTLLTLVIRPRSLRKHSFLSFLVHNYISSHSSGTKTGTKDTVLRISGLASQLDFKLISVTTVWQQGIFKNTRNMKLDWLRWEDTPSRDGDIKTWVQLTVSYSRLPSPVELWRAPRMEISQSLWTICFIAWRPSPYKKKKKKKFSSVFFTTPHHITYLYTPMQSPWAWAFFSPSWTVPAVSDSPYMSVAP